jgi:TonB family protein
MMRTVLIAGGALMSCSAAWAEWEAVAGDDLATPAAGQLVRSSDSRGNSFLLQRDAAGNIVGYLLINAFLSEPDSLGTATPLMFSIDGKAPQSIREGRWEAADLYRRLGFEISGTEEAGLSESIIDILEGAEITFRYSAGSAGYQEVSFPLQDPGGVVARTLAIALPVDHAKQSTLRETHLRVEAERQAQRLNPVDPDTERARRALIDRQKESIQAYVTDRWARPAHWAGLSCTLQITLMSTGKVLQVAVLKGSGDPDFDASLVTAVRDASPLPLPADPALFDSFQQLDMVFDSAAAPAGGTFSGV